MTEAAKEKVIMLNTRVSHFARLGPGCVHTCDAVVVQSNPGDGYKVKKVGAASLVYPEAPNGLTAFAFPEIDGLLDLEGILALMADPNVYDPNATSDSDYFKWNAINLSRMYAAANEHEGGGIWQVDLAALANKLLEKLAEPARLQFHEVGPVRVKILVGS